VAGRRIPRSVQQREVEVVFFAARRAHGAEPGAGQLDSERPAVGRAHAVEYLLDLAEIVVADPPLVVHAHDLGARPHAHRLARREIDVRLVHARVLRVGQQRIGRRGEVGAVVVEMLGDLVRVDALQHDARACDGRGLVARQQAHVPPVVRYSLSLSSMLL
jgi:hypothetical protein